MSKNKILKRTKQKDGNLEKEIMTKIATGQITMKPKWYFVAGSLMMTVGLTGLSLMAVFFANLNLFLLHKHGPGIGKLEIMLETFPWWVPLLALLGIISGIWLLKKYDFSYRKNFFLLIFAFIVSIIISAWFIDRIGLNEVWSRRGPMRRLYQQFDGQEYNPQKSKGNQFYHQDR
jgi:hypothetical protein